MLALALAVALSASHPWTTRDSMMMAVFYTELAVDVSQTHWALYGPRRADALESNPILGAHPSKMRLNITTLVEVVAYAAIAYKLPHPWREIWQGTWIAVEGYVNMRNAAIGCKLAVPW